MARRSRTRAELKALIADLPQAYPSDPLALGTAETKLIPIATTLREATIGNIARTLWILLASVDLVLLGACVVANLFLVRSEARQREVAVRQAPGASRLRIARYFVTESRTLGETAIRIGAVGIGVRRPSNASDDGGSSRMVRKGGVEPP